MSVHCAVQGVSIGRDVLADLACGAVGVEFGGHLVGYRLMDTNGGSFIKWVIDSDLFDAAYVNVAKDVANWWWSAQLLNFAITLVVFFWAEGAHRVVVFEREGDDGRIKGRGAWFVSALLYTVLGFLGAISAAFPLFLIQRSLLARAGPYTISRPERPSTFLTFCAVFSGICVMITPYIPVASPNFGINLKVIHVLLLAPLITSSGFTVFFWPSASSQRRQFSQGVGIAPLYGFLAGISLMSHLGLSLDHFLKGNGTVTELFETWEGNPCQLSISADLIFTTVVASVFMLREAVIGPASGRGKAAFASLVHNGGKRGEREGDLELLELRTGPKPGENPMFLLGLREGDIEGGEGHRKDPLDDVLWDGGGGIEASAAACVAASAKDAQRPVSPARSVGKPRTNMLGVEVLSDGSLTADRPEEVVGSCGGAASVLATGACGGFSSASLLATIGMGSVTTLASSLAPLEESLHETLGPLLTAPLSPAEFCCRFLAAADRNNKETENDLQNRFPGPAVRQGSPVHSLKLRCPVVVLCSKLHPKLESVHHFQNCPPRERQILPKQSAKQLSKPLFDEKERNENELVCEADGIEEAEEDDRVRGSSGLSSIREGGLSELPCLSRKDIKKLRSGCGSDGHHSRSADENLKGDEEEVPLPPSPSERVNIDLSTSDLLSACAASICDLSPCGLSKVGLSVPLGVTSLLPNRFTFLRKNGAAERYLE
ncbi:asparagine-linked glycosylation protein [Dinochytrium kinnereticum]|nr:asparagine-linked glycosylation protein [Dinochytrium kinnereticum]